ncbi:sensor histidine kinase [Actinorhabdospora filicis]|nr:histidine kinase [Actinorhabdospora filicis]
MPIRAMVSLALAVFCVAATASLDGAMPTPGTAALLAVPCLLLALPDRLLPVTVAGAVAGPLLFYGLGLMSIFAATPTVVAVFLAARAGRTLLAPAAAVLVPGVYLVAPALDGPLWIAAWLAAGWCAGYALRQRDRLLAGERLRAEAAERQGAERERLRIARELHDSLTHGISVISVQAGVAQHLPERAPQALAVIRAAASDALRELRATVEVLRRVDDGSDPAAPGPGLRDLARLVTASEAAGLTVTVHREPLALTPELDRAAYRIAQESLANAARHAPGASVTVHIGVKESRLVLRVHSGPGTRPGAGGGAGTGIAGMRERAALLGGELTAGPERGGFTVHALLPMERGTP